MGSTKSVIQWNDFFAMNECRDLMFHVQEHHITLREIKLFLAAAGGNLAASRCTYAPAFCNALFLNQRP